MSGLGYANAGSRQVDQWTYLAFITLGVFLSMLPTATGGPLQKTLPALPSWTAPAVACPVGTRPSSFAEPFRCEASASGGLVQAGSDGLFHFGAGEGPGEIRSGGERGSEDEVAGKPIPWYQRRSFQ
jgi:hypothetical protein